MINRYTTEHKEFIRENIKNPEKVLVDMFNARFEIKINLSKLGNLKTKLGLRSGLIGGRFEKGQKAFNKGKKWDEFMPIKSQKKCLKTTFKKGNLPHNHKPIGSERITKDGYIEIKVSEPNTWQLKHRYIYEKVYGKIPSGDKLIFLDGNRLNISIENLQLVSSEQALIMSRNHYFTENKTLTQTGVMISRVISKTRKLKKEKLKNESK